MATFAQIKARVERYLIDLPEGVDDEINGWVNEGVRTAQERHSFRVMEATAQFTTTAGTQALTKPADWKEMRVFPWLDEDGETKEIRWAPSHSEMVRAYDVDADIDIGAPEYILETDTQLIIYPIPDDNSLNTDGNYIINVPYWKYLAELSADADTNFFTETMEDYCVFFAVSEGMVFNREEDRAAVYVNKAAGKFNQAVRLDKRSRLPRRLTLAPNKDVYGNVRHG